MSRDRSKLELGLERQVAIDGDWGAVAASPDDTFKLSIRTEPGELEAAKSVVKDAGGDIQSAFDTLIVAEVTAEAIPTISDGGSVRLVGEWKQPMMHDLPVRDETPEGVPPVTPTLRGPDVPDELDTSAFESDWVGTQDDDLITSEGVSLSNADQLHDLGVTGEGATIAIIDGGFDVTNPQYEDQVIATIGADDDHAAYNSPGGHGDSVTDIVAAMAPDADLILADIFDFDIDQDLFDVLDILEADYPEVDVANFSVGFLPDFRIDGLDPISLRINQFTDDGRIFVNSAGNSGAVENAWAWIDGFGPWPFPQNRGDAYDSQGIAKFDDDDLLVFDHHFDEDLDVGTRLPLITPRDVTMYAAFDVSLGWTVAHWDADPVVDDQEYAVRLFGTPDAENVLRDPETGFPVESVTANPWETIDIIPQWFEGETELTMDVIDGDWKLTGVDSDNDVDVGETGVENPELTFPMGQRYVLTNEAADEHPLQFVDRDGEVLLSQDEDIDGIFEDDDFVDWEVIDDETVAFTMTDGDAFFAGTNGLAGRLYAYESSADSDLGGDASDDIAPPIYVEVEDRDTDEDHHFDIWAQFGDVNIPTPWATDARTVGIPATSRDPDLFSVAAVQAVDLGPDEGETELAFEQNAGDLKGYSSHGPTQDGRTGIDLAGSAHVSTEARGPIEDVFGFNGTSAAAPHVAGAAALLSSASFRYDVTTGDIRSALGEAGTGIADPEVPDPPNTAIGDGFIDVFAAYYQLTADVTIQVQGSTVVPDRTVVVDESEDDRFADNQYTITAVKVAEPGDELEVNVGAPDDFSYNVELFDTDLDRLTFRSGEGDDTATFDTGDIDDEELDPGMYVLGVVSGGEAHAAFPVIISAYSAEITKVSPAEPQTGDTLEVWAEVEKVADDPPAVADVLLGGLTKDNDTAIAVRMDEDNDRYHAAVADPPAGDYQFHVAPRSDVDVSFPFDPLTSTELSSTGVESDDTQVGTMTVADGSEPLGLSPGRDVEVELSDTDALEQRWSVQSTVHSSAVTGGLQFSRPAVDNENVFVGGVDEFVTGHARNSGEERWNFEREGNLSDVSPVLHDGVIYVGSGGGYLYAIDADDGTKHWDPPYRTDVAEASPGLSAVTSTPAIDVIDDGPHLIFGTNNGVVHRVVDVDGNPVKNWATDVGAPVFSEPTLVAGAHGDQWIEAAVVTTTDGRVVFLDVHGGYDENPGEILIDVDLPVDSFGSSSPVYDAENNYLYLAGEWVHAIDVESTMQQLDLVPVWEYKEYGGTAGSDPTVSPDGNTVYVGSADGKVNALSTEDGDVLWRFETGDAVAASPAVTSDRVVAPSLDGTVYVIDRASGRKEHSRSVGDGLRTEPVILNDNVYLGTEGGDLLKLQNIP